ncbi:pellino [Paragonimus westermani]|uniref:Pellino n=1 Tax=Paragonimus westermani TaxID=34504 RepID=A0A5J4P321_9TREM|nr:pellino [Paragonimus westermani]
MADPVLYGELAIIGFNGISQLSDRGPRRTSKISLYKRPVANGVCPGPVKRFPGPQDSCAVRSHAIHSVSYTLSRNETVVVEYIPDPTTDMFQIGRSTNSHIDFVVSEPVGPRNGKCRRKLRGSPSHTRPPIGTEDGIGQSTHIESAVSRFACRIHVKRDPPHTARIYAAGFDASNNIFLGELAVKWKSKGQMDGLTTNGIMILRADPERYIRPSCGTDGSVVNACAFGYSGLTSCVKDSKSIWNTDLDSDHDIFQANVFRLRIGTATVPPA